MGERVLVAYGTKYEATREIADAIGAELVARGVAVDVKPAKDVRAVDDYDAVVLGSAVYMGRWRGDAMRVLKRRRKDLAARDVWLFSSGPVDDPTKDVSPEQARKAERWTRPRKVEALATEIGAHEHKVFEGRVDESGGFARRKMAESLPPEDRDQRDWDEIRAWAGAIAVKMQRTNTDQPR